jgi:hypothetical protein
VRDVARQDTTERTNLTVTEAASLWNVTPSAIYTWIKKGWLDCFNEARGVKLAPEASVRSAKVLQRSALFIEPFKIARALLSEAERQKLICPSPEGRDGRFSLDDVAQLKTFARDGMPTGPAPQGSVGAEGREPDDADEQSHQHEPVLRVVPDDGTDEDRERSEGDGEREGGENRAQVNPRQAELDAVVEAARREDVDPPPWFWWPTPEYARGDAVYPPTTRIGEWWKAPEEMPSEVADGRPLALWYAGRVAYVDNEHVRLTLYGPAHAHYHDHRGFKRRMTREEWARYARFEPEAGQYVFYAIYRHAANPRNEDVRILAQPERTHTASTVPPG